jgi:hypothetical protein
VIAADNQALFFGSLTMQGGTGPGSRALLESQSNGQTVSASTTQILGGTGMTGAGQDAGAYILNNTSSQSLSFGNLTIRSGADFAPAGIVNLGDSQSVNAGAVTIGTAAGANGFSTSSLGGNNMAGIFQRGTGAQSLSSSTINIDNQDGNGEIGVHSATSQSLSTGTVSVNNATATGIAKIDATTTQSLSAGNITVTSAGTAGKARITAGSGTQTITGSGGLRLQNTAGSGLAQVQNTGGGQTIAVQYVDVSTGAPSSGSAEIIATGDQSIHTSNGLANVNGSMYVAALGTGTARIETSGSQLLEIDYPELMQANRDGRITVGTTATQGVSLIQAAGNQDIFAKSIAVQGGQAAGGLSKLSATNTQTISTVLGGISATGGAGGSGLIDPLVQNILSNGLVSATGGSGAGAVGGILGNGSQTILVTAGGGSTLVVSGGSGANAFGQITTTGNEQRIGTAGGFDLFAGTGTNSDAIIGASGGTAQTFIACGLGTCAFTAIPSVNNPFVNGTTDVGVYYNPTTVSLADIINALAGGSSSVGDAPFDATILVLWNPDLYSSTDDNERLGGVFSRRLPVCR